MNQSKLLERKCAPLLGATAGLAVCLSSGGMAFAATGAIGASNGGQTNFVRPNTFNAFNSLAKFSINGPDFVVRNIYGLTTGTPVINQASTTYLRTVNAGVVVSSGMPGGFNSFVRNRNNVANKFMSVKFNAGGVRFGWIHIVSIDGNGANLQINQWGYNSTTVGGSIKTLSDSLTARKFDLADGKVKLHWTNSNEDGVSRYEVQAKDAEGEWQAVDSDTPGDGRYTLKTENEGDYRLMVEKIDGTSETVDF